jgi:hypothetical protein
VSPNACDVQFSYEEKKGQKEDFVDQEEPDPTESRFPGSVWSIGKTPKV